MPDHFLRRFVLRRPFCTAMSGKRCNRRPPGFVFRTMLPARLPGRTVRSGRETCGDLSVGEPRVRQAGIRSSAGARAWRRMFSAMCGAGKSRHRHSERVAYFRISLPGAAIARDSSAGGRRRSRTAPPHFFAFAGEWGRHPSDGYAVRPSMRNNSLDRPEIKNLRPEAEVSLC